MLWGGNMGKKKGSDGGLGLDISRYLHERWELLLVWFFLVWLYLAFIFFIYGVRL